MNASTYPVAVTEREALVGLGLCYYVLNRLPIPDSFITAKALTALSRKLEGAAEVARRRRTLRLVGTPAPACRLVPLPGQIHREVLESR